MLIGYPARRNPQLQAVGVELPASVADMARRNMAQWGLRRQVAIESGDIREKSFPDSFDAVTPDNNIYYFPAGERTALLQHLRRFLKPGDSLIVTTGCQGGTPAMELLKLWGAATQGRDRLPAVKEMAAHLAATGFAAVHQRSLLPGGRGRSPLKKPP